MASITSLGAGSGLALEDMVSKLMSVERQSITTVETKQASFKSQVSALGKVTSALSALKTAADAIKTSSGLSAFKTSVSDSSILNATTSSSAVAATHSIEVSKLAQTHTIASSGYASTSATIATGTLTLQVGTLSGGVFTADGNRTKSIVIDSSNNTLEGLRAAINASGADVTASIVNDGSASPQRLVIASKNSGTANTVKLAGLTGFNFDPATGASGNNLTQTQASQDAALSVDGIAVTSSSNSVTSVLSGVTLNLTKTNVGAPVSLAVTNDGDAVQSKLDAFVKAYNEVNSTIRSLTTYDSANKKAAELTGDSTVRQVRDNLRSIVSSTLTSPLGGFKRLSDIGISFAVDGTMQLDSSKVKAALADPTKSIGKLFAGDGTTDGFAKMLSDRLEKTLATDGSMATRTNSLNASITAYDKKIETLESRMDIIEARYRKQFSSLDTLIAGMNSTSTFLTQQLSKKSS